MVLDLQDTNCYSGTVPLYMSDRVYNPVYSKKCSVRIEMVVDQLPSIHAGNYGLPQTFFMSETVNAIAAVYSKYQKMAVLNRINSFRALPENWNGNGAPVFSAGLIDIVTGTVENLSFVPEVFPTGRNSIQIEFTGNDAEDYLEFEFFPNGSITYLSIKDGEETESTFNYHDLNDLKYRIDGIVADFYA